MCDGRVTRKVASLSEAQARFATHRPEGWFLRPLIDAWGSVDGRFVIISRLGVEWRRAFLAVDGVGRKLRFRGWPYHPGGMEEASDWVSGWWWRWEEGGGGWRRVPVMTQSGHLGTGWR